MSDELDQLRRQLAVKDEQIKVLMAELAEVRKELAAERGEDDGERWLRSDWRALASGSYYGKTHITRRG